MRSGSADVLREADGIIDRVLFETRGRKETERKREEREKREKRERRRLRRRRGRIGAEERQSTLNFSACTGTPPGNPRNSADEWRRCVDSIQVLYAFK